jgi:hypothetical protein
VRGSALSAAEASSGADSPAVVSGAVVSFLMLVNLG